MAGDPLVDEGHSFVLVRVFSPTVLLAQGRQEEGESRQGHREPKRKVAKGIWMFKSIHKLSTGSQSSQITGPSGKSPGTPDTPSLEKSPVPY